MLWAIRQIFVPVNYLRIQHGEGVMKSKAVFDYVLPAVFTAITVAVCVWLVIPLAVFQHPALTPRLLELMALMVVFYMAALAAVATFERKGIDNLLRGGDATLWVRDHSQGGKRTPKKLTYRQFISYLFGYLSFLSLLLYIALIFLVSGWPRLQGKIAAIQKMPAVVGEVTNVALFVLVFFFVWQLVFASLLGIYFLTERIQSLNDPES